jgi:hypothetical protein
MKGTAASRALARDKAAVGNGGYLKQPFILAHVQN